MGTVFNIQRFSLHDVPGIRTTFFLTGCSLRCQWCHNPEGLQSRVRLQYDESQCIQCRICEKVCPKNVHVFHESVHIVHFDQCSLCEECINSCPSNALQKSGKEYTAEELAQIGLRDMPYYQQNGGITFSGGEPLLQASFVAKTADLCRKKGVNTIAIDTAGNVDWKAFEAVLPFVDYVLYDVKAASEEIHRKATGFSNHKILDNLHRLDSCGKKIFIRIPLIPTINDDLKEIEAIAQLAAQLHTLEEIRIVPYHTFGREKYKTIGLSEPALFPIPDDQKIIHYERIIQAMQKKKHHP